MQYAELTHSKYRFMQKRPKKIELLKKIYWIMEHERE